MSVQADRGSWRVRWRERGTQLSRSFDTREDAERFDRQTRRRLQRGRVAPSQQAAIRVWAGKHPVDDSAGLVYVITARGLGRIKIGRTSRLDPLRRLRELRTGAPLKLELVLLLPGGSSLEQALLSATEQFAVPGASREWRTADAVDVVLAYVHARARCAR